MDDQIVIMNAWKNGMEKVFVIFSKINCWIANDTIEDDDVLS